MSELQIEIEAPSAFLAFELFSYQNSLSSETPPVTLPDGSTVAYAGTLDRRSFDFPSIVHALATLGGEVSVGLLTNWLYDKLKGKPVKLRINRREVEITPEKIRILVEEIEREG